MPQHKASASNAPRNDSKFIKIGEASKLLGVSVSTIRNYCDNGTLSLIKGAGGHRLILRNEINRLLNPDKAIENERFVLCYSRISTKQQEKKNKEGATNLTRQKDRLEKYAVENYPNSQIIHYSEQCSSANPNRKEFNRLIIDILNRKYDNAVLLVEFYDRISRHYRSIIQLLCDTCNIEFIAIEQDKEMSDLDLLMQDFSALFFLYQIKTYSNRAGNRLRKEPTLEAIQRGRELVVAGYTVEKAVARLKEEGFDNISAWTYRKYVLHCPETKLFAEDKDNSAEKYIKLYIQKSDAGDRLPYCRLWEHYTKFCEKQGLEQLTKRKFYSNFRQYKAQNINPANLPPNTPTLSLYGLKIRGENLHVNVNTRNIVKVANDFDGFFKFYEKYKGQVLKQANLIQYYRQMCKAENVPALDKFQVFTAIEQFGARKLIKQNQLHWELI